MALLHVNFFSYALGFQTAMDVILPQPVPVRGTRAPAPLRRKFRTLYLLHGWSDDHTIWQRRTSIERYVEGTGLAVVMPAVHFSFYTDEAVGRKYWTFVSQELPALCRVLFPLSYRRDDNFVAGLSMGGYGAFKLALSQPDRWAAAASLSGALDIVEEAHGKEPDWAREMRRIFGDIDRVAGSPNDLFALAHRLAKSGASQPRLYQWCGKEDFLYPANLRFRDRARKLGLDLTYQENPGGHEWVYWDAKIQDVLAWLIGGKMKVEG